MSGITNDDLDALLTRLEQRRRDQPDATVDEVLSWLFAGIEAIKARAALGGDVTDDIVRRVKFLQDALDRTPLDPEREATFVIRTSLTGEIHGLWWALCLLKGWDPREEACKEGRADDYCQERAAELLPEREDW
jgi:hypothetical protein